jgi:hypothetical protein
MPEVFAKHSSTVSTVATHHTIITIAEMGHRHSGAVDNRTGKLHVCSSGSRILHQMDRGEASSQHSSSGDQEVLLVEYNMSFQSAQKDNSQ